MKTLVILWNLAVKLLSSHALKALLKVCIDTDTLHACCFFATLARLIV